MKSWKVTLENCVDMAKTEKVMMICYDELQILMLLK